jgi:hypothetical protein
MAAAVDQSQVARLRFGQPGQHIPGRGSASVRRFILRAEALGFKNIRETNLARRKSQLTTRLARCRREQQTANN